MFKGKACVIVFLKIVFFLGGFPTVGKRIPSYAGPYRIIVNRISNDTDEFHPIGKFYGKIHGTHPRHREQQYLWGNAHLETTIGDDLIANIRIAVWKNNQWKQNAFVFRFDHGCTSLLTHLKSILNFVWLPEERKCPLPAFGDREFPNRTWDFVFPHFPVMPYDRYRAVLAGTTRAGVDLGVIVADATVVPRV